MNNGHRRLYSWALVVILSGATLLLCSIAWFTGSTVWTVSQAPQTPGHLHRESDNGVPCPDCEDDRDLVLRDPPMYGDDVRDLQTQLKLLGFYKHTVHGFFDHATSEALKSFQQSRGKPTTGVMTQDLWYVLGPSQAPAPPPLAAKRPQGLVSVVVDTRKLTVTILDDGKPFKTYPCAIGKPSTPTPIGEFIIRNKWAEPGGPFGARWMGLNIPWGTYGIHGTNRPYSIGSMASAGCVRMFNHHVSEIFPWIPIGTHVLISGPQPYASVSRNVKVGDTGTDVQYVQYKVRQAGFKSGMVDGRFGTELRDSLMEIQRFYGLPVTGTAGPNEYHILGIK